MKHIYKKFGYTLFALLFTIHIQAQDHRTLETKVADILAQLPTTNLKQSDNLSQQIINLGDIGITQFTDLLVPLGTGNDTQARFAIESLAIYSGRPGHDSDRALVEKSILKAIKTASDNEVKMFLVRRLIYCGSDASLNLLGQLIPNIALTSASIGVIRAIGTDKAGRTLLNNIANSNPIIQQQVVQAIGAIPYKQAVPALNDLTNSSNASVKSSALYALARIATPASKELLFKAAKKAHFKIDYGDAVIAYIEFARNLGLNGQKDISNKVCKEIIKNTNLDDQLYIRSAAFSILSDNQGNALTSKLLKEAKKTKNIKHLKAILNYAQNGMTSANVKSWVTLLKKLPTESQVVLLNSLAHRKDAIVLTKAILPSLKSKSEAVRIEAIKALAINQREKASPILVNSLKTASSKEELSAIKGALLRTLSAESTNILTENFASFPNASKVIALQLLGAKRATQHFNLVAKSTSNSNSDVQTAAYNSISNVSTVENIRQLIHLLQISDTQSHILKLQAALSSVISDGGTKAANELLAAFKTKQSKAKLLPVFPALNSIAALQIIKGELNSTNSKNRNAAINALLLWKSDDALPYLYEIISNDNDARTKAFRAYLQKVNNAFLTDDQKLLLIRKLVPYAHSNEEKIEMLAAAGEVKTFLSLVFVSQYIETVPIALYAMNAVTSIVLPEPGENIKIKGDFVRKTVQKVIENLSGPDSQYIKIDLIEFLKKMPKGKGYMAIFNGKDFSGWQGLVKNPKARAKMSKPTLAKEQKKANVQMLNDWFVKEGVFGFKGEGYNNICTIKKYGDFEMLVDWKITNGGDSGIYLRGTPQVQIWDIARTNVGAQVGSGGLYNNQKNKSIPLKVADNPVNEWNTFRIKMIGERVTVYLNGILVTDNVILENYWDRKIPIYAKEAIELQAHGEDLGFRDIYVREIHPEDSALSQEEKKEGFVSLFNGTDLDYWIGNKKDYIVEDNVLAVRPKNGGHGNLYTAKEYSDFNFRFEFQLTPGANNGLGIHTPLTGDAAYVGKELQILDNTAAIYKNLKPYQYHGSVYGIIPSKRGYLNPVGEWNRQEVIVRGNHIKIILNGVVILDGNIKEATKNGTADHKEHPGLQRTKGHIAFLGHGSELEFRNIRIKDLTK